MGASALVYYSLRLRINALIGNEFSELLGIWTLSIVQNSKYLKTQRVRKYICFHPQVGGGRILLF
jgi:hypothetical protein